ncbi:MAG: ABC transporter permease subunit [Lachnospiraceae bacterium]|nr:ABC transporter permease [Robinsoniella sp.]MDY3766291.1 ABC transporter permease subunit [Lachnospiraceae bacterium]
MKAVYKRELKSYFDSMIGYIFIAFLVAMNGIYFLFYNLLNGYPYYSYVLGAMEFIILMAIPVLTMKCLSDERRSKTDQLLLTSPVSLPKVILGKYLAMETVFAIPIAIFCLCPLIIKANGTAYLREDFASIFAFFMMGSVFVAIGMFISSLTESQIIAAVGTFGVVLVIYLWSGISSMLPDFLTDNFITKFLPDYTVTGILENFTSYHLFDVGGLIFYLSLIFLFLFFTIQSVQKRRWS